MEVCGGMLTQNGLKLMNKDQLRCIYCDLHTVYNTSFMAGNTSTDTMSFLRAIISLISLIRLLNMKCSIIAMAMNYFSIS